jgi:alanine racemase
MSRIGITPDGSGTDFVKEVVSMDGISVEGIFTHFARADEKDLANVKEREKVFADFVKAAEEEVGVRIPLHHCANSASIIAVPESSMDMVRAGVTMYGMWPSEEVSKDIIDLKPTMELISHVVMVKEVPAGTPVSYGGTFVTNKATRIATIPVGYGDGYPRSLSNKGFVLIRGKHAPILGRVCMDQFMVDVSDIPEASLRDEVILFGTDGDKSISVEEVAEPANSFNYELVCNVARRVPRVYFKNGRKVKEINYLLGEVKSH